MINWPLVADVIIYVAVFTLVWFLAYTLGERSGKRHAVREIVSDLDETIDEWRRLLNNGDPVRAVELPGLVAIRRMLGELTQ